ncbi:DUF4142 domain-containing protein [Nubsella zeaxanthinifaciens]|uniref:DUF4142 domain-containing protein n=1 Tax=Nubsella zeaxanthinifaciens TaxID=392412 RepID=UPI000DE27958|nr:DUF4142 domain-containing protein [Nubsella zeaxanthinifaciens]
MKNLLFFLYSVAFTVMIACNSQPKDAKELADSVNATKDTTTNSGDIITVRENEAEFATNAADAGLAEINFANLAISKTNNADVKMYANMMLKDHGAANDELTALAKSKNISLPVSMSSEHQKNRNELAEKTGADFDKKYLDLMEKDHVKVLAFMEHEAREGTDPDLKAFASKTVPVINAHLNAVRKIKEKLK